MEKLRATNSTEVLVLLISEASRLITRCRATELNVAAGLLVTTNCGEATSVAVTFMCRRRLLDNLRGHPLVTLWLSLIPLSTVPIWLVCLVPARLQRNPSGRETRRVIATIGPSEVVGPRNIVFIHWLCRLVSIRLGVLTTLALSTLTDLLVVVANGSSFSTVPETTDPLELEELTRLICLLLVTVKLILEITNSLLIVTPRLRTLMSTVVSFRPF